MYILLSLHSPTKKNHQPQRLSYGEGFGVTVDVGEGEVEDAQGFTFSDGVSLLIGV